MTASDAASVENGWQPACFCVKPRTFSSCCWNDCEPVDLEPFRALRDGCRLRSGSCIGTCSYTSSAGFDPGMTFIGHDDVLTGGSGWMGRTGRTPVVKLGAVTAAEVWGFGARTLGLMHVEGGEADIGTGDDFAWWVIVEDSAGLEEDELSNMFTCDRSAARHTAGLIVVMVNLDWNVWRLWHTGGDDDIEQPGTGCWLLLVEAAMHVTIPSQMLLNWACRTAARVDVGDEVNRSWIWLTLTGNVFALASSTANSTSVYHSIARRLNVLVFDLNAPSMSTSPYCDNGLCAVRTVTHCYCLL